MEVFEAFKKRNSYRFGYTDQKVSHEDLVKIVEAGMLAPSGKNCQTTEFVIINDKDILKKISQMHPSNQAMQQAKAYIACIVNKKAEAVYEGLSFEVEDCAAATENMLLAITALGYSSVWVDGWIRDEARNKAIRDLIGLPDNKVIRIILPIGVASRENTQPAKKDFAQRAWFNSYKNSL